MGELLSQSEVPIYGLLIIGAFVFWAGFLFAVGLMILRDTDD